MERRTYYRILGVSRADSATAIRAAYRELARRLHPDVGGAQTTRAFQEITEAYEVLSDPQRRREYNDALTRAERADRRDIPVRRAPAARVPIEIVEQPPPPRVDFEVLLDAGEAARGCIVPLDVPVMRLCPSCGAATAFACATCGGVGLVVTEESIAIRIPPGAPHGTRLDIRLSGAGIDPVDLRLLILVPG